MVFHKPSLSMFFLENIGFKLSVDETTLTIGELYTITTNKVAKDRKGVPIVIIQGPQS
ncbi:hypothetical protein [Ancylomarina sp. 16SWW S1-10-2]|uniref:hypothetical protein n=1 Tax=Ancylomarina sp. 16SWW S1-10-2 TaxID=2499681 RepID=UPI00189FB1EF|nr:hypothetical protein [Ancylomarina sp. 16SWW S1-10-2]